MTRTEDCGPTFCGSENQTRQTEQQFLISMRTNNRRRKY